MLFRENAKKQNEQIERKLVDYMSKLDTSDLLTKEDEELLNFITNIRQNIPYIIGKRNIIDEIRTLVKNSELISFRSKRHEVVISEVRPLFVLTLDKELVSDKYNYKFKDTKDDLRLIQKVIEDEVTTKFSNFLSDQIRDKEHIKKLLEKNNFDVIRDEDIETLSMLPFITASIFAINYDPKSLTIYVEYVC